MNKLVSKLCFSAVILTMIISCKKNSLVVDKAPLDHLAVAEFALTGGPATSHKLSYFIANSSTSELKIPIGITTVSNVDRTIKLSYTTPDSAGSAPQLDSQYSAPTSIVIPAGKALDTLRIHGIFAGFQGARKDTLKIRITGGDVAPNIYSDSLTVYLQKYCDVVLSDLLGDFTDTEEYDNTGVKTYPTVGGYLTSIYGLTSTGATTATGFIANLYDDGWNDIPVNLDWTDPANFKVSIPLTPTGKSYSGAPTSVRTATGGVNTFSSCDQSFTITVDLVNNGTTVVTSKYRFVLKR